ncbi:hypothetical protein OAV88_03145 [bacterium]|jgi:hypothetical protein|nr:hypothetical protein [bacterium]
MGMWILDINWLRECAKSRKWIEETPFEIQGDMTGIQNGPHQSRIQRNEKKTKLFEKFCFDLEGHWDDDGHKMKRSDVRRLLKLCGAKERVGGEIESRRRLRVFCEPSKLQVSSNSSSCSQDVLHNEDDELVVSVDWILNSISAYELLPVDEICGRLEVCG